ncbi:MAG: phosphonopyruvate decarboxylase [Candidatus Omnitrophica bacterium]|nr:phosphonopyruvate decarboxylase [Candidatus Omnitrophota bacterium]
MFTGVPDSLMKDFCAYIEARGLGTKHIITANEGAAVALAMGHYLAEKEFALVYMQNSGLGNAINPILSLADSEVYGIPMLLLIGWRGEPGVHDEPQHLKQGKVMLRMLDVLGVPYCILSDSMEQAKREIDNACCVMRKKEHPYALIVRKGTFEPYKLQKETETDYLISREQAIKIIIDNLSDKDIVVSTTGKVSREVFEYREELKQGHGNDFLTVGSMGHCSQIALGIALSDLDRRVCCLDGDGAIIMHMGAMAITGKNAPSKFIHIVLNNGSHDSVGGQPTAGFGIDFVEIAKACGYKITMRAENITEIRDTLDFISTNAGPAFVEIRVNKGARKDLGRPDISLKQMKKLFMEKLSE